MKRGSAPATVGQTPGLREMVDVASLHRLCNRLSTLAGVAVVVRDAQGKAVVPPHEAEDGSGDARSKRKPVPTRRSRGFRSGHVTRALRANLDEVGEAVIATGDVAVADAIAEVLELFLFVSLKSHYQKVVHEASVQDSFLELKAKNRELKASYEKLKALDLMKSNFLATVSHELRTPLTSILGYADMVLGEKLRSGPRRNLQQILVKGEQLLEMINSVLDMSKIESGRMDLKLERIDLRRVVEESMGSVRPQAAQKGLKLSIKVGGGSEHLVADRDKLRQVLVNLLSNAVKFTPHGGRIVLSTARVGRGPTARVVLKVADNGIGIPAAQQDRVFERFFQVDNSSTRQYGGTGLGLAIARNFVELHGGAIRVESEPGRGTTMIVEIPLQAPSKPAST